MLSPKRDLLRRLLAVLVVLFITLAAQTSVLGLGNETVMLKQSSSSLKGVVTDSNGEVLEKVSVAFCEKGFHECSEVTATDKSGRFAITRQGSQRVYFLKFSLDGMDPEAVTVTLKRSAGPLNIKMIIAT